MSNVEARPEEVVCAGQSGPGIQVLEPRDVPLGGPRAMTVRRTLPQRALSLIGAWCFLDHYGPDDVSVTGGMDVPPHPHTGLATVSWLFSGQIEHRDSAGHEARIGPGALSLMTAGAGISHSERSTAETTVLHGVQMWVALPEDARFGERGFTRYEPPVVHGEGYAAQVFLGSAFGDSAPISTATQLLGAEVRLKPGARVLVDQPGFELGVLVDTGEVTMGGTALPAGHLGFREAREESLVLAAGGEGARVVVFGGPPFGEEIVMWWNFVGRDHDEIVAFRSAWQTEIGAESGGPEHPRFDLPADPAPALPAPTLPPVRIRPRAGRRRD
ncbi:pirin family protein [Ruania alkalisoli]|uniref:Pirin family protein n=1 Tax=Ruania alkalisoli TaxID=2779775 RepID=A0A7M1SP06_9MICO|nr:pirin family protein [Ruania alkalisoli]QOR69300.1 pirin family protein [Ruania alkalisoli]